MTKNLKASALAACRRILRPVVRILLKHGVMHKELIELTKELYVEVARSEYGIRGRPTNVSRVALLTGLGRKEIARLKEKLEQSQPDEVVTQTQDRIARVLTGWYQDSDYLDAHGKPRTLPTQGRAPSFESLVRQYGGDVPAVTIMRELSRSGAIQVDAAENITVLRRNYRLDLADPEALSRAGSVLEDIGRTVTHNLYHPAKEPTRLEARASNVNIPLSAIPAYRDFIYAEGQTFLESVDAWLSDHEAGEGIEETIRLGIGIYWLQSDSKGVNR